MLGENHASHTRHRSTFRWMRALPFASPSSYCGRNADMSADRCEERAACVCSSVNVGSCARSFCSIACSDAKSSSSSDEGAAVFCEEMNPVRRSRIA